MTTKTIVQNSVKLRVYALFTNRGTLITLCEKLPFYWMRKVAKEGAQKHDAIMKRVWLTVAVDEK